MNRILDPRRHYSSPEDMGDDGVNTTPNPTMGEVIAARYSRRGMLKGALAITAIAGTVSPMALLASRAEAQEAPRTFNFKEVVAGVDETHHVAEGYDANVLLRWGDPLFPDAPEFDPRNQTANAQARQFGYNNDFIGLVPTPDNDDISQRALLVVNHEYTTEELMFPGLSEQEEAGFEGMTQELVDIELMAHGGSVVKFVRTTAVGRSCGTPRTTAGSPPRPRWRSPVPRQVTRC